jgi:hypothetical protein
MGRLIQFSYLLSFYFAFKIISFNSLLIESIGKNTMGIFLLHCPPLLKVTSLMINNFITYFPHPSGLLSGQFIPDDSEGL